MTDTTNSGRTIRDVMTPSPVAVDRRSPAVDAARAMVEANVGSLPVVDGGELVGMVTDRDLMERVMARGLDPNDVTIGECCSDQVVSAQPGEPLDDALERMAREQIRRLPVVEQGQLVGIVAQADIAKAAQPEKTGRMVEEISRD